MPTWSSSDPPWKGGSHRHPPRPARPAPALLHRVLGLLGEDTGECVPRRLARNGSGGDQPDFILWAAPLKMGFPSTLLKMANDKHLPLIHPYMVVDHGEAHHLKRYPHYPRLGLLLEKEPATDDPTCRS